MTSMQKVLGSIVSLWRYPVKSMMGEELNAAEVTKDGLLGDRAYALVDSRRAATAEEYWPDIEGLDHRDAVTDFGLPDGTFFDCAFVHLLTTATLGRLRVLHPEGRFEVRRFRPNIIVETANGEKEFTENAWIGQIVAIGDAVRLSITGPCARCVMTTLPQGDLPKDAGILRTAAQHNHANVGVYASVLQSGKVRRGDSVTLE
jgi:uncharacterized protein